MSDKIKLVAICGLLVAVTLVDFMSSILSVVFDGAIALCIVFMLIPLFTGKKEKD